MNKKGKNCFDIDIRPAGPTLANILNRHQVDLIVINCEGCEYAFLESVLSTKNLVFYLCLEKIPEIFFFLFKHSTFFRLNMSQHTKVKTNTKVSSSWSNIEETPSVTKSAKSSKCDKKRVKKRDKTGKSEKRTQQLRKNKITFEEQKN